MSEREYLRARAAQERELASAATDSRAARIHSAMAAEYERRLLDVEAKRQFERIASVTRHRRADRMDMWRTPDPSRP